MLLLALSHTDFLLPPAGAQALRRPLDLELGGGEEEGGGSVCGNAPPRGRRSGCGRGLWGSSAIVGGVSCTFPIPRYIQGAAREPYLCLFQNEGTRAQGWAGCHGGTMAQLLSGGAGFRTRLVNCILTANLFFLRISLRVR